MSRRRICLIVSILLLVLLGTAEARKFEYLFEVPLEDGARLCCVGGVNQYSLWPTLFKWWERRLQEKGCLQIHQYMIAHPADWTMWHLYVPDSTEVSFDALSQVVLRFANGREPHSHEILATESPRMCEVFSTDTQILRFCDGAWYSRSSCEAFVIWIAFDEGSLDLDHDDRDLDKAEFVPPAEVIIERRDVR